MKWTALFVMASFFINSSKGFYIQPRAIQFSAPPISQSLLVNSSLHLSCGLLLSSSWLPSPVIHWYHNGEKMDVEGDELAISSAQLGDAGEYHCGAVDGNMTSAGQPVLPAVTISRKAHVNVIAAAGGGGASYHNHTVTDCSSLLMRCLDSSAPPPSVSMELVWTRNDVTLSTNNSMVYRMTERGDLHVRGGVANGTLGAAGVTGVYRCHATSAMVVLAEHGVALEESAMNERGSPTMISITLQPSATLLLSSSSLHLMCLLKSACDYSAVQWTKDGQTLQDNGVVISNDVVEINSTTLQHSGNYCCELSGVMNCQYITVIGSQPDNSSTDILNSSLPTTLSCSNSSSNLSVEWYRNGHKMSAIDGTTLTIPTAAGGGDDTSALGVYQCFIVNMTGPTVAQYRILPYGLPNPPHTLTHTILPIYGMSGSNISFQWQPPLHTAGLNLSLLQYRFTLSGANEHTAIINTTEYIHVLFSSSSDNCTWKVEIVDSQLLEMVISEPSNEAYVSGNYLLNYPPKPPLLSLACTNQIPVLNWTEVVYGYYNPKRLCVEHTCHSEDNTTTDEHCSNLELSNMVVTGKVNGSVKEGVATRCTFTAWQITSVAMMFLDYTTVTGTPTTTHTDCGEHHTTSVSLYGTSSADSVTMMTSPSTVGGESTVSAIEQPVTTSETVAAFQTSSSLISSLPITDSVSLTTASSSTTEHTHSLSLILSPYITTTSAVTPSSTIVPSTTATPNDPTIMIVLVAAASVAFLVMVLFAAMCITILLRTRRNSKLYIKEEDAFHFFYEDPKIPQFIAEDARSIKTVYESPSPIKRSNTPSSTSSLPHIQATVLTDDRDEETLEEEGRRDSLFEAEENTKLGDDVIEDESRLTVVADSSVSSSRRTSGNSDTSSSTVYSEDSNTGYLRLDSSGFHSDYTDYRKRLYSHQILEEDDPGSQNSEPKILKDFDSSSGIIGHGTSEQAHCTVQEQRHGLSPTLEETGSQDNMRWNRDETLSPLPSSFSSNVSTFTETTV